MELTGVKTVVYDSTQHYRPMLKIWVTIALSDPSAFHLLLSHAALFRSSGKMFSKPYDDVEENDEAVKHYTLSLRSVSSRLHDAADGVSEGLIGSIVGFACHDVQVCNFERWRVHMQGVKRIVKLRGGMQTLKYSYPLRLIDVNGCLSSDMLPHFPFPSDLVDINHDGPYQMTLDSQPLAELSKYDGLADLTSALTSVAKMAKFIHERGHAPSFWKDEPLFCRVFLPVAHEVLSVPRLYAHEEGEDPQALALREPLRLACLAYLSLAKRRFSIPPDGMVHRKDKIFEFVSMNKVDWTSHHVLGLWVTAISALVCSGIHWPWHAQELHNLMNALSLRSWSEAAALIKDIAWVDEIAPDEGMLLEKQMQSI
ncbi:hypothetical protein K402DRAFT_327329 [Aulographum hederae CBS 113979]|uniref:Uncharacterized protein n=1 Tax=Aulographum hederae CBS 113979 TaxID=1176131 RepID=A0A6G1H716_9PEZI|nr:hypothetical protein K402DRAFT_327329 [Aulographum hederae CBS 113979]